MENKRIRNLKFIFLFFLLILIIFLSTAYADTRYVTDELSITMRSGMGTDFRIIKNLKSGTPLEVLEEQDLYLKVRTQDGTEGWVRMQYISSETPKAFIITKLEKELGHLKAKIDKIEKDKDSIKDELKTAKMTYGDKISTLNQSITISKKEAAQTAMDLKQATEKYNKLVENSKKVVEIADERDKLKAENNELNKTAEYLQKENSQLRRKEIIWWFLAGAGVFFVGWITGKASRKKRLY